MCWRDTSMDPRFPIGCESCDLWCEQRKWFNISTHNDKHAIRERACNNIPIGPLWPKNTGASMKPSPAQDDVSGPILLTSKSHSLLTTHKPFLRVSVYFTNLQVLLVFTKSNGNVDLFRVIGLRSRNSDRQFECFLRWRRLCRARISAIGLRGWVIDLHQRRQ